jgi:hypothetical protein
MSAFDIINVRVSRKGAPDKTQSLGYSDVPDEDVPGSPFPCRYYRRKSSFAQRDRAIDEQGTATVQLQHVLSIQDATADVRINDVAHLPTGTVSNRPVLATIVQLRMYDGEIQCDLKTTAEGAV